MSTEQDSKECLLINPMESHILNKYQGFSTEHGLFRPEPSSRNIGVEDRHKDLQRKDVLR